MTAARQPERSVVGGSRYATSAATTRRTTPRDLARHAALSLLAAASRLGGSADRVLARPRVQFLNLHHVFPDEEDGFRALLGWLLETHRVIGYSEAVQRVLSGDIDRNYVCVSFDDGLKSCAQAARIMTEFGVKGCFFICPAIVGETDYATVAAFCETQLKILPVELLSWNDVERMLEDGHEIGSHTMRHARLWEVSGPALEEEITGAAETLTRRLGGVLHFAWPFGGFGHFTRDAAEAVHAAGHLSCASSVRGCHGPATAIDKRELCLRRDHVVASWPLSHIRYFMAANSRRMSVAMGHWPENLAPAAPRADDSV